jgi:hypothetical protein
MNTTTKVVRAGFFGLVIIFFLLPFVVVSCPNTEKAVSISGFELATGTVIRGSNFGANIDSRRIDMHWQALAALLCAVAGVVCSFIPKKLPFFLCLVAGAAGILFMILLRNRIAIEGAEFVNQGFRLYYASGFWTAIVGFCLALVVTLIFNPYTKLALPTFRRSGGSRRRRRR